MKTKLLVNDLELELASLYMNLSSEWDDTIMEDYVKWDIKASEQLNDPAVGVTYPDEDLIVDPAGFDDNLCNAALFIEEDTQYLPEAAPSFEDSNILDTYNSFISQEQRDANTKFYFKKLAEANNWKKLAEVRNSVLAGQKGVNGAYFFNAGKSKEFWAAYHSKKEQLNKVTKVNKILYGKRS